MAHERFAISATTETAIRVHSAARRSKNRCVMREPGAAKGRRSTRVPPQQAIRIGRTSRYVS